MIRGGLAKSNLYVLFIITLLLALLVGGSNILANPQRAATLDRLEKENLELRGELGELSSRYEELQGSYERLKQEKKELENGLDRSMLSNTAPIAYLTFDDGPGKYAVRILENAAAMHGCTVTLKAMGGAKSGASDPELVERVRRVAETISDFTNVHPGLAGGGGSEDFTYMMERVQRHGGQATFISIGADINGAGHHTAEFDFDERAMRGAVKLFVASALDIMQE